ncbi:MAG: glycosyltransferase [Lachnospiraceae bacterium]|nr:glycosyltransferase [Lachnospiraceae bacterium]
MVKVSFVVAIYNVGRYLGRCIESLIGQTVKEIEIILVNDGSSDNCLEICNSYAAKDDRITVIDQKNQGANAARNNGLHAAQGEWVYFVDGDDYVDKDICANLAQYMPQGYEVIFFTNEVCTGDKVKPVAHSERSIIFGREDFQELQLSALNRLGKYKYEMNTVEPACIWNKIYNRKFLEENRLEFVPNFPKLQDISFNLLVYDKAEKGIYLPVVGYYYQINQESVTRRYQPDIIGKFEVVNQWFGQFAAGQQDERFAQAYAERVATHIRTCIVLYLCNSSNPEGYRARRKRFLQIRMREPYYSAVQNTGVTDYRGYKEKILAFAVKRKWFAVCEMLCRLNDLRMKITREVS